MLFALGLFAFDYPNFRLGEEKANEEFRRGLTYKNRREYSAAKERFLKALQGKRDFLMARYELSHCYFLLGEWDRALEELEILKNQNKNNTLLQNKIESLRLMIAGGAQNAERVYFSTLDGDESRGYRFRNPVDIVFDEEGNSYVAGFGTANIVKHNAQGVPISNWKGGLTRKIEKPVALAYRDKQIYMADFLRDEILIFDTNGSIKQTIGGNGNSLGRFRGPSSLSFDKNGNLYVADTGNQRIQKFDRTGSPALELHGTQSFRLRSPTSVAIYNENIYVVDKELNKILVYDMDGNGLRQIQNPNWKKLRSIRFLQEQMVVVDELSGIWFWNGTTEEWDGNRRFRDEKGVYRVSFRPFSINIDPSQNVYLVDFGKHRVDIFSPKNYLLSNLNLDIESIDTSEFPEIHIYTRVTNRIGEEVIGIDRLGFRIFENDNLTPLFSLARKQKLNAQKTIAIVYENSEQLKKHLDVLQEGLTPVFKNLREYDNTLLYRAGKDGTLVIPKTLSLYDSIAKIRDGQSETKHNFGKASLLALQKLSIEIGPKALILLTSSEAKEEGFLQYDKTRLVRYAKSHRIPIFVLAFDGKGISKDTWEDLTIPTGGKFITLGDATEEKKLPQYIQSQEDLRYVLSYKTDTNPALSNRFIKLVVTVDHRKAKGKEEGGYFVPEANP